MDIDFDEFFRRCYAPLVRALAVAAGHEEAADAVQDAFVEAHRHWGRVSNYEKPDAWVRRVALNRLTDGHRQRVRLRRTAARIGVSDEPQLEVADLDLLRAVRALPGAATAHRLPALSG